MDTDAEIDLEALPLPATSPAGPVKKPTHTDFLLEVIFTVNNTVPANVSNVLGSVTIHCINVVVVSPYVVQCDWNKVAVFFSLPHNPILFDAFPDNHDHPHNITKAHSYFSPNILSILPIYFR